MLESLCKLFGSIREFIDYGSTINDLSGTRVLVANCDVNFIPHFMLKGCCLPSQNNP